MQGSQGKDLERGNEVETMGECYLLACCPGLAQLAFLHNSEHLPSGGTLHSGLPHWSVIKDKKTDLSSTNLMKTFSQLKFSIPRRL